MKLINLLKEINLRPNVIFQNIQQLVDYINKYPKYKTELVNAVYDDVNFQESSGWLDIKSDIINGETITMGDMIGFAAEYDGILISLEPIEDETNEGSFTLNGNTFYYGLE